MDHRNCGAGGQNQIQTLSVTPAALEEPSTYLDTAIMEMMKKIMEAVTHRMKSLNKERNSSGEALTIKKKSFIVLCFPNDSHHQRPEEAFEPLIEFSGVGKQQEESSQELQQRDGHKSCCCGCREAHERHKGKNLRRQLKKRKISGTPTL